MAKVYFKYATMGAGKTGLACMTAFNYEEKGLNPICLTPSIDTRSGEVKSVDGLQVGKWKSRISALNREAFSVDKETDISKLMVYIVENFIKDPKVIIIDEVQFFSKEQIEDLFKIALKTDIPIICYGLLTNFKTELFEGSKRLIELGAKLSLIKSVGYKGYQNVVNGKFKNGKLVTSGDIIDIGGNEKYQAITLQEYFKLIKYRGLKLDRE